MTDHSSDRPGDRAPASYDPSSSSAVENHYLVKTYRNPDMSTYMACLHDHAFHVPLSHDAAGRPSKRMEQIHKQEPCNDRASGESLDACW